MIPCPNCFYGEVQVIDTRDTPDGGRRRRYRCRKCDYRFTTGEMVIGDDWHRGETLLEALVRKVSTSKSLECYDEAVLLSELLRRKNNGNGSGEI